MKQSFFVCVSFFTIVIRIGGVGGVLFCFLALSQEKEFYLFILTRYSEKQSCLLGCWRVSSCTQKLFQGKEKKKEEVFLDGSFESVHSTHLVVI